MGKDSWAVRAVGHVVVTVALVTAGCGGDDGATTRSTVAEAATEVVRTDDVAVSASTLAESGSTGVDVGPLEGALLIPEDLGESWETDGAYALVLGDPASEDSASRCPDGEDFARPTSGMAIDFDNAADLSVQVSEYLLEYDTSEGADSWRRALDSCVGTAWEESDDPVEEVTIERLEVADLGDDASGYREVYAHSGNPEHDAGVALVRVDEVVLLVWVSNEELTDPYDQALLDEVLAAAVSRAKPVLES